MSSTLANLTILGRASQTLPASAEEHLIRLGEASRLLSEKFRGEWDEALSYAAGDMVSYAGAIYVARTQTTAGESPDQTPTEWRLAAFAEDAYIYVRYATDADGTGFSASPVGKTHIGVLVRNAPATELTAADFAGLWTRFVGQSAYVYVRYANDTSGTGFSESPAGRTHLGVLVTDAPITPQPSDFTGKWVRFTGESSYTYVRYANDTSGTGFSANPTGKTHVAILSTNTPLTPPQASDFAGLWVPFVGPQGETGPEGPPGADGADGASSYTYIAYASDAQGTNFTTTFNPDLNFIAIKTTTSPLANPQASDFAGLWKRYGQAEMTAVAPVTLNAGEISVNAAAAATPNYLVRRDANGDAALRKLTLDGNPALDHLTLGGVAVGIHESILKTSVPIRAGGYQVGTTHEWRPDGGKASLYSNQAAASALDVVQDVVQIPKLEIPGAGNGVIRVLSDRLSGGATTDNLPEGNVNRYHTEARVRSAPLTGLEAVPGAVAATDTVLQAVGKLAGNWERLGGGLRVKSNGDVQLKANTGLWHSIRLKTEGGVTTLEITQTGES